MRSALSVPLKEKTLDNPALILQRYLPSKPDEIGDKSDPAVKRRTFDAASTATSSNSLRQIYEASFERWTDSFEIPGPYHRSERLQTNSRVVIGLGTENVLEAGLRLNRPHGVPIVPGSALKGLASHYCHEIWGALHDAEATEANLSFRRGGAYHRLLFGKTDDSGIIIFHDSWILPESLRNSLRQDIITAHHHNWQNNPESAPTDFDSPVPIPFVSIAGTFDVRVSWAGPVGVPTELASSWTDLAMRLLTEALKEWGIGGKVTSGYGRLTHETQQRKSVATEAARVEIKSGDIVEVQLLEKPTKKGGRRAVHEPSGRVGNFISDEALHDRKPGDRLQVKVEFVSGPSEARFRFPVPPLEPEARKKQTGSSGKRS
jgi:CRISPR-associated protein Cmr6